jgi:hypothetical protein
MKARLTITVMSDPNDYCGQCGTAGTGDALGCTNECPGSNFRSRCRHLYGQLERIETGLFCTNCGATEAQMNDELGATNA